MTAVKGKEHKTFSQSKDQQLLKVKNIRETDQQLNIWGFLNQKFYNGLKHWPSSFTSK